MRAAGHPDFPPPAGYTRFDRKGWPVFIHENLVGNCDRALELLDFQLQDLDERIPAPALAYLKKVPLYFTPSPDGKSGACHHPSSHWLRTHGKPVEMAKTIEFTNVENFEFETRRMPNFALHELAHAFHNHIQGDGHQAIRSAYRKARESGTYQNIPKRTPKPNRPVVFINKGETYAMSNQMEYFAEASEAYFAENDFHPFDRPDLLKHDPEIYHILEDVWGVRKSQNPVLAANRILILGDSITANRAYVTDLQAALHLQGHIPEIISIGLGSEGVSGLSEPAHPFPRPNVHERLDRALELTQPDLVIACYGMNDGIYHPFSEKRFRAYQKGIQSLIDKTRASGAELILMTPTPFDSKSPKAKEILVENGSPDFSWLKIYRHYDRDVLSKYAQWILEQKNQVTAVVDLHTPFNRHLESKRTTAPDFTLSGDGIHPDREGHRLMAGIIHEALLGKPLPDLPPYLVDYYHARQAFLSPAWVSHIGHKRPGIRAGLPVPEARARAAQILRKK